MLVDESNFLAWKQHVLLVLKTQHLSSFIDETVLILTRVIAGENGNTIENPAFVQYEQQDSAIAAWILSIISLSLHNQLIGSASSSFKLWEVVTRILGAQSVTKAMRYRSLLHNFKKNDLSMSEYLASIKHLCDSLSSCGQQVSKEEHKFAIINGLL